MLSDRERAFLLRRRIGHLATADSAGVPHLVPVCFALGDDTLYTPIDEKPKRGRVLKRLGNIAENPRVSFLGDYYDEDWSQLGWVMIEGVAGLLETGFEFDLALELLRGRYAQYETMRLSPVIAIRELGARAWGNLDR